MEPAVKHLLFSVLTVLLVSASVGASAPATGAAAAVGPLPEVIILDQVPGCYGSVRFDHRVHVQMSAIKDDCKACHHELPAGARLANTVSPRSCRSCHEPQVVSVTADKPGLRGAYHRQCLSCHRDWAHENGCGFCHTSSSAVRTDAERSPHGAAPRATAQQTYLYQTGHKAMPLVTFRHEDHVKDFGLKCTDCHAGNSCGQCHGAGITRPVVNRQQSCYGCHAESRCVTCHQLKEREKFDHGTRTGWYLRPGHASLACNECHTAQGVARTPKQDDCGACHAKRWGDAKFDHARTGVALYGDHALFDCLFCHRGGDRRMVATCSACHEDRPATGERRVGREVIER